MSNVSPAPDFLADVLAYIEARPFEPMTVAELASVAGFSPYHFSRLFTARFGESVMSYVRTCRLQAAALRLMGDKPPALVDLARLWIRKSRGLHPRVPSPLRRAARAVPAQQSTTAGGKDHVRY
jgi:AraC-like DNA-binding protein